MTGNEESEGDIKPPVRRLCKELTQRYTREIVKEAIKKAIQSKGKKEAHEIENALKDHSDQEIDEIFQNTADKISRKILEGETRESELLREISEIIEEDINLENIAPSHGVEGGKRPSRWKRVFGSLAKITFVCIAVLVIYNQVVNDNHSPDSWEVPPAEGPILSIDVSSITFDLAEDERPSPQTFRISNAGGGTLTWRIYEEISWISLSQNEGSDYGAITVSVLPGVMESPGPGTHSETITVESNGGVGYISVTLYVEALPKLRISLYDPVLNFEDIAHENGTRIMPEPQAFTLWNEGGGALEWEIEPQVIEYSPWILVDPASGSLESGESREVTVSVNSDYLEWYNYYSGKLKISSNGGSEVVDVNLKKELISFEYPAAPPRDALPLIR